MFQNRVLLKLEPNYFTLSDIDKRKALYDKVMTREGLELFGREFLNSPINKNQNLDLLFIKDSDDLDRYNIELLKLLGYGDSLLFSDGRNFDLDPIHYDSLYDSDKAFEEDQFKLEIESAVRQGNQKRANDFSKKTYAFRLRTSFYWHLDENNSISYLTIHSAHEYLADHLNSYMSKIVDDYYPRVIRNLKDGEEPEGILGLRGKIADYNGQEDIARELRSSCFRYSQDIKDEICNHFKDFDSGTIVITDEKDGENSVNKHIVVINEKAAKEIKMDNLYRGMMRLSINTNSFDLSVTHFEKAARAFVEKRYEHLEKNFEPGKVRKIKEAKIAFSDHFKAQVMSHTDEEYNNEN